jgi:hypothetical protein
MRCGYCGAIMTSHRVELVDGHTLGDTSGELGGNQDAWRAAMACPTCRSTGPSATGASPKEALDRAAARQKSLMEGRHEAKETLGGSPRCSSVISGPIPRTW